MKTPEERRRRRMEKRRAEILQAAREAFLARRYSEVTMEEIADAADISKATLYLYFPTKAAVYGGMLAADMQILSERLEVAYDPELSTLANVWALTRAYRAYFDEHVEYFTKLSFFFFPGREERLTPELAAAIDERLTLAVRVLERCLQAGLERGEVRPQDPWTAAVALWGVWQGTYYLAVTERTQKFDRSLDDVITVSVENFLLGILVGDKEHRVPGRPVAVPGRPNPRRRTSRQATVAGRVRSCSR